MASSKNAQIGSPQTNGAQRRKARRAAAEDASSAAAAASAAAASTWVGRVDALAGTLSALDDRSAITAAVAGEIMALVPAASVIVREDGAAAPPASGQPVEAGRVVVPLACSGRSFGALEVQMKAGQQPGAPEQALIAAMARQCALALERRALVESPGARTPLRSTGGLPAVDLLAADLRALVHLARSAALPPPSRVAEAERIALAHLDELRAEIDRDR